MSRGRAVLLAVAAAAYVLAAWQVRPGFYDGTAPAEPYRFVSPPPQLRSGNQAPLSGRVSIKVGPSGTVDPGYAATGDGQAALSFTPGTFAAPGDRSPVVITVTPEASFPDPGGVHLATNVYCFASSSPLLPGHEVLVTLRYSDMLPAPADVYGYEKPNGWHRIGNLGAAAPFSISVRAPRLGCFAGGYPEGAARAPGPRLGGRLVPILVALAILVVVLAGVPLAVLRRRREPGEEDRPPPKPRT